MERFTDKMARVQGNVKSMIDFGAPDSEIDSYLNDEGVTSAHMRQYRSIVDDRMAQKEKPNILERVGRGMTDIGMGVGQLTGFPAAAKNALTYLPGGEVAGSAKNRTDEQVELQENIDSDLYEKRHGGGIDVPRIGGQAAATAVLGGPAAAAEGLLARTALGAAGGAGGGLLLYASEPGERLNNVLGGALGGGAFGAAGPYITKSAGALYQSGKNAAKKIGGLLNGSDKLGATITRNISDAADNAGIPLSDLGDAYTNRVAERAKAAINDNQPFDYDAAVRQARAEQFGFVDDAAMMRGQATRDPKIFSQERNLSKRPEGAPIAERLNNQLAVAEKRMDDLAKAPDLDPVQAGDAMRSLAGAKAESMQGAVRSAYKAVPDGGSFPRDSLANRTAQILADHQDDISSGVKSRIASLVDPNSNKAFVGDELIKLDKLISETMPPDPTNPARGMAAGKLKEALLGVMDDAESSASAEIKSAYSAAKKAASERFKAIGPHGGLVSQLVHGTVDPTKVVGKIATGGVDDLRRLRKFLDDGQWETVQRSVENYIVDGARPGGEFSQAAYDRVIKRVGKERLKTIFGEKRAQQLLDFRDVARDVFRYPNLHTINTSNTAPEAANIVKDVGQGLLDVVPGGRLAGGLLSRAGSNRAAQNAQKQTEQIVFGLLSGQPPRVPQPNPALPALPYVRGASPAAGLLGADFLGQ